MNKSLRWIVLCLILASCQKATEPNDFSDDYVLVEFAARLEEDYDRLYPQPLEKLPPKTTEQSL